MSLLKTQPALSMVIIISSLLLGSTWPLHAAQYDIQYHAHHGTTENTIAPSTWKKRTVWAFGRTSLHPYCVGSPHRGVNVHESWKFFLGRSLGWVEPSAPRRFFSSSWTTPRSSWPGNTSPSHVTAKQLTLRLRNCMNESTQHERAPALSLKKRFEWSTHDQTTSSISLHLLLLTYHEKFIKSLNLKFPKRRNVDSDPTSLSAAPDLSSLNDSTSMGPTNIAACLPTWLPERFRGDKFSRSQTCLQVLIRINDTLLVLHAEVEENLVLGEEGGVHKFAAGLPFRWRPSATISTWDSEPI